MNKILFVLASMLIFECYSQQKSTLNAPELKSNEKFAKLNAERNEQHILLDTLVFNQDMDGELLEKKYALGLDELQFYKRFIFDNKINEKQILIEEHKKTEITYLGKLNDLDKQASYHVITNFKIIGIGEMPSPRGASYIAFLNDTLDRAIIYLMGSPNELPKKIENNVLYFTLKSQKVGISVLGGLPPMLCLPIIGCQ